MIGNRFFFNKRKETVAIGEKEVLHIKADVTSVPHHKMVLTFNGVTVRRNYMSSQVTILVNHPRAPVVV